ncbi:MAG: DUF1810 domain-containing protein [Pseudomonadota bacterium]
MFDPQRFLDAQAPVYNTVLNELLSGHKRNHWMWFIFPQLAGLGHSDTARRYALAGLADAQAYLAHPVLGERLRACSMLVGAVDGASARAIFDTPDDLKFRSCMTLFARAAPDVPVFTECLHKYFDGKPDPATLALL